MTNQKALDYFKRRQDMRLDDRVQEYENTAISALKKQIHKKLDQENDIYSCPVCDKGFTWHSIPTYCLVCGQRVREQHD